MLIGGARVQSTNEGVVFVLDLSEQKRAEGKIREQEAELRQMLDLAPQIIAVYGPTPSAFMPTALHSTTSVLVLKSGSRHLIAMCTFIRMTGNVCSIRLTVLFLAAPLREMELRLRKADGTYRWFFTRCVPLRDDKGQISVFILPP